MVLNDKTLTPPAPLDRGEHACAISDDNAQIGPGQTPSPVKGRAGEGLKRPCRAYNPKLTALAQKNRKNPTPAETLLWQKVLRHRQFEAHKFHRQKPIGTFIVDFYCKELHLVIEIDGDSHADQIEYDQQRTQYLNSLGLRVLRYTNADVLQNLAGVFDDLSQQIAES